jgi:PRA1 family protein 3
VPKNGQRWRARCKCNAHYFRGNYLFALALPPLLLLLRRPFALFGVFLLFVSLLCANDSFGSALNEGFVKLLRRANPHAAAVARSALGLGGSAAVAAGLGAGAVGGPRAPRTRGPRVLGLPRVAACALLAVLALWVVWRSGGALRALSALLLGAALPAAHASLRSPNLKVRLGSARDEFRAVWRGHQQQQQQAGAMGAAYGGGGGGGGGDGHAAAGVGGMVAGYGIGAYYSGSGSLVQTHGGVPGYGLDAGGGAGGVGQAYGAGAGAAGAVPAPGTGGGGARIGYGGGATDYTL